MVAHFAAALTGHRVTWVIGARFAPHAMDEEQAGLLGRLAADYADAFPTFRDREPRTAIVPLLHRSAPIRRSGCSPVTRAGGRPRA